MILLHFVYVFNWQVFGYFQFWAVENMTAVNVGTGTALPVCLDVERESASHLIPQVILELLGPALASYTDITGVCKFLCVTDL